MALALAPLVFGQNGPCGDFLLWFLGFSLKDFIVFQFKKKMLKPVYNFSFTVKFWDSPAEMATS